jgi:inositol transport system substrate-binding protein
MNRRRFAVAVLITVVAGMIPFTVTAKDKFTVGYANLADSDVWLKKLKTDFTETAKSDPSLNLVFADANGDINKQLDQIDNFIAQKVDAIVVLPVDYDGIVPGVEKANAAGIPVIALAIRSHGGKFVYVGSSNVEAGRLQAQFMHDNLPKNAQIVYLQGTLGLYHSNERYKGFTEALNRPDVKILAVQSGDYDRAKGMAITEDWIQAFPKFDGVVAANDQMALGALQALKAAGRNGVLISGIDGLQDTLKAIVDGDIAHTVFQNATAQAKAGVGVLEEIKAGKEVPGETIVPFEPITKENVAKYLK